MHSCSLATRSRHAAPVHLTRRAHSFTADAFCNPIQLRIVDDDETSSSVYSTSHKRMHRGTDPHVMATLLLYPRCLLPPLCRRVEGLDGGVGCAPHAGGSGVSAWHGCSNDARTKSRGGGQRVRGRGHLGLGDLLRGAAVALAVSLCGRQGRDGGGQRVAKQRHAHGGVGGG